MSGIGLKNRCVRPSLNHFAAVESGRNQIALRKVVGYVREESNHLDDTDRNRPLHVRQRRHTGSLFHDVYNGRSVPKGWITFCSVLRVMFASLFDSGEIGAADAPSAHWRVTPLSSPREGQAPHEGHQ